MVAKHGEVWLGFRPRKFLLVELKDLTYSPDASRNH